MKIAKGFTMRNVCGNNVVVATGLERIDFNKVIALNDTAAYLWEALKDIEFSADTMTSLLLEKYEVDEQTAAADASKLLAQWVEIGLVEE